MIESSPVPTPPRAGAGARVAAAVGGIVALVVAAVFTAGAALVAPVGIVVSRAIARARGKTPGLLTTWIGAVVATALAIAIGLGVFFSRQPRLYDEVRHAVDSATVAAQHDQARPSPLSPDATRAVAVYGSAAGALISVGLMGLFAGSLGWLASWPLAFAISGRWREPAPIEPLPADL